MFPRNSSPGGDDENTRQLDSWLRCGIVAAFSVGAVCGALLFTQVQYLGFLLPALTALYVGNLGVRFVAPQISGESQNPVAAEAKNAVDAKKIS